MTSKSFAERIAEVLIEDGLLLPNQLEEAVSIQKTEGGRLLKILTDKQFVTEQDMAFSTGRCLNTPPINLAKLHVPEEVMALVPRDMAKTNKLVPIARLNGKLFVAMADPTNVLAVDDLKRRVQLEIVPMIATERAVNDALSGVHGSSAKMSQVLKKVAEEAMQTGELEVQAAKHEEIDLDRLAADSEDAPVIKIVNLILVQALKEKASDIHIEPFQNTLKLRYRIDGELSRGRVTAQGAAAGDHFAHQDSCRSQHRRATRAARWPFSHQSCAVKRSICASRFCPRRMGKKSSCVSSINRRSRAASTRWVWRKGRWKNFARRSTRRME